MSLFCMTIQYQDREQQNRTSLTNKTFLLTKYQSLYRYTAEWHKCEIKKHQNICASYSIPSAAPPPAQEDGCLAVRQRNYITTAEKLTSLSIHP
jgi:hypothetical protein